LKFTNGSLAVSKEDQWVQALENDSDSACARELTSHQVKHFSCGAEALKRQKGEIVYRRKFYALLNCLRNSVSFFMFSVFSTKVRKCSADRSSRCFLIASSSFWGLKGFKMYPSAPSLTALIAFSKDGKPVMMILTIFGCFSCSLRRSSVPSISGSLMSIRAKSKRSLPAALIACFPLSTVSTEYPSLPRIEESIFLTIASSSTTRMLSRMIRHLHSTLKLSE